MVRVYGRDMALSRVDNISFVTNRSASGYRQPYMVYGISSVVMWPRFRSLADDAFDELI